MATGFANETLEVVSGTTTAWLPIFTPWLSIAACSSQVYAQRNGLGGNLIAFDPLFGQSIVPSAIPCLPTEVTSSWYQSNTAITSVLGPTFVCPGAYSAVQTILVNSLTQQVLCCPSQYTLNVPITGKGTFPSQCTSRLTSGQTLTYQSTTPSGPWGVATTVVPASTATSTGPTIVYGMHVNGFNIVPAATHLTSSGSTLPVTASSLSPTSQVPSSTSGMSNSNSSGSLSKAATAGIGVGVTLGVVAVGFGAWLVLWRMRRRQGDPKKRVLGSQKYAATALEQQPWSPQEMEVPNRSHEMPDFNSSDYKRKNEVHEMASA